MIEKKAFILVPRTNLFYRHPSFYHPVDYMLQVIRYSPTNAIRHYL